MSNPGMLLTALGKNVLAKGLLGKEIKFSKVAFGAGDFDYEIEKVADLTALKDWRMDLPIVDKKIDGDGTVTIVAQLRNFELDDGFPAKEIGIFAIEPDSGVEILYAYRNAGDEYNFIPAKTGPVLKDLRFAYEVEIQDAENVTFNIDFDFAYLSIADFENHVNSTAPHPNTPTHFDDVETADFFWVTDSDSDLHKISVNDAKKILGIDSTEIKNDDAVVDDSGLIFNDFAASFIAENVLQKTVFDDNLADYVKVRSEIGLAEPNILMIENFNPATLLDSTKVKITSCAKGGDLLSAVTCDGIKVGWHYWLSDGFNAEPVIIDNITISAADIEISGANFILKTSTPLLNSYNVEKTFLYRTDVSHETSFSGNLPTEKIFWQGSDSWSGLPANEVFYLKLDFDSNKAKNFIISGNGFFADSMFTLF